MARVIAILGQTEVVEVSNLSRTSRDPKDDKFLVTACAAGVAYLVSEDEDLLSLGEHEGVKIINMATFLRILEQAEK